MARECAAAGVRALLVISAGFAEAGEEGSRPPARAARGLSRLRASGSSGRTASASLNTAPGVRLNATFAPNPAPPRSASGSCPRAAAWGSRSSRPPDGSASGSPHSSRSATGPTCPAPTSCSYWEQDPATDIALLYLESFGNARKFARIAPRFARKQAAARRQERALGGRRARHVVPHRRAAVRLRCDRRRAVPTGRRDPHRHAPRAVRRRRAPERRSRSRAVTGSRS